jgi:hypothetical protein
MGQLKRAHANTRHPTVIATNVMATNVMVKPSERHFAGVPAAPGECRQCIM